MLSKPKRSVIIFQNQLAMLAVLDLIEISDSNDLAILQMNDQILPTALVRRYVTWVIVELHDAWVV